MTFASEAPPSSRVQLSLLDRISSVPWPMLMLVVILSSVGVAMQYSAGGLSWQTYAGDHLIRTALFFSLALIAGLMDIRLWFRVSYIVFGVTLVMLLAVPFLGEEFNGAKRWIDLRVTRLQPSELIQVGFIMALARYLHSASWEEMGRPLDLIFPVLLAVLPIYLIMNQPDLGTSLKLMACLSVILFLAGLRWWLVLAGLGAGIAGAYWFIDRCLQHRDVFHGRGAAVVRFHPPLLGPHALHDLLCLLGIVPKLWVLGELLVLGNFHPLLLHAEVAFQLVHALAQGCDLVHRQHGTKVRAPAQALELSLAPCGRGR